MLGDTYIAENVVGKTSREDCFHIALATLYKADILVSCPDSYRDQTYCKYNEN